MTFALVVVHLHLPHSRSLKEKRRIVKSLVDRIHKRFRVSVAETDFHDLHQRSEIGLALVHQSADEAERVLNAIRSVFDEAPEAIVIDWLPELVEGVA